jgi:hypothetical protein
MSTRKLLRTEASAYLKEKFGISRTPKTLAKMACLGGGPRYYKTRRETLYDPADLDEWVEGMIGEPIESTSAAA